MKLKHLFALAAFAIGGSAWAQNLLPNSDFSTVGALASGATDRYAVGTPWVSNVTFANMGIRVMASAAATEGGNVLVWRGSGNSNYISQPVAAEAGAAYEVTIKQVASGNANANFNVGIGTAAGSYDIVSGIVRLGTNNDGEKTVKLLMPMSVDAQELYFTFANTTTNSASSGNDPVSQIDYIKMQAIDAVALAKEVALANLPTAGEGIFAVSQTELNDAKTAINNATSRAAINEAVNSLEIPALTGNWAILNATNGLYLGQAVLSAESQTATFEQASTGFYIKIGENYINMRGDNNWSMSAEATAKTAWTFNFSDNKYTIQGPKGLIGTDATTAGSAVYGNKDVKANGRWIILDLDAAARESAKAALGEALTSVVAKPTENIGNGVFQYSQAVVDAYQAVINAAQTVYDNAESTTQEYTDAKASLDDLQYPVLTAPVAGTAYKMEQNGLSLNPETNKLSSTASAIWFEAVTGGYKIKSNTGKYIKYEGSNNWTMTTTDDAASAAIFSVDTNTNGLTFNSTKGLYGGDANSDGAEMYGDKATNKYVFWAVSEVEVTEDYDALNSAIATAEANTLGFENGEYAPYNNADALKALAAAKALDQNVPNVASVVTALVNDMNGSWTANDGDVAIVYNGDMLVMDGTSPKGWNGAGWGQQNVAVDGKKVYYYNSGRTVQYGTEAGYTMPLKAATVYQLTYSYGSQGNNSCKGLPVSVNLGDAVMESHDFGAFPTVYGTALKTVSMKFTTKEAGNYTLNFGYNGNVGITDVQVVKVAANDIPGTTITAANGYGTFISPVDRELPTGLEAYTATVEDGKVILTQDNEGIKANTAYILKNTTSEDITIPVKNAIDPSNSYETHETGALTGVYDLTAVSEGDYLLQNNAAGIGFYQVNVNNAHIGANRCYIPASKVPAGVKALVFDSEADAIQNIEVAGESKAIYDLMGRKVNNATKGIYIINGKKVLK